METTSKNANIKPGNFNFTEGEEALEGLKQIKKAIYTFCNPAGRFFWQ
jgi:hypothetical protein